ncbi:hypothetical protein FOZ60_005633 [Perkinsus olseni]|uniref:3'-5' exonuclease domain-containing protein n=1 Tax=Perkinsus olseni TaxID=32597 RepID=A0A7J6NRD2_PEROL|nr:hypothetical protein FOZ60_005633 [Perkinsus olseni]
MPQYDTYGGPIYIIDGCDDDVEFCEENLYGRSFVGIDFEWDRELRGQRNQIELVQIATPTDGVFLFRCLPGEPLHPVARSVLTDWNITKVCSGYDNGDCARLWETYSIEVPRESLLDMHDEARDRGPAEIRPEGHVRGLRLCYLQAKIRYAAADAWFPLLVAGYWDVLDLDVDEMEDYVSHFWFPLSGGSRLSGGDGDLTKGMAVPMLPRAAVCGLMGAFCSLTLL